MLAPRSASAKHSTIHGKSHGIKNLPMSPNFSVNTNASTSGVSPDVVELKDMVKALLLDKKVQNQSPALVKAVDESCVTCGGAHSYRNCPATDANKEPPRSIFTWDDLVSKFINQFFPPSKTTSLRNKITNFKQRFDESFSKAWGRFKYLFRACPHHGFSKLHQLDTFYNALNSKDQDSLNSTVGGNFLDKMARDCLCIIKSKSKIRYSHDKPVVAKVNTNASTSGVSPDVVELKDMVKALLLDKKVQNQSPALVKAVDESCVTCGGAHSYRNCPATDANVYHNNIQ
nr:reverse transcriptase domain-containing protein [Tanacetum cinerariifolium]